MTVIEDGPNADGLGLPASRVPVIVVNGSFGAGKTSVLKHILSNTESRMAVITNDITEVGFDLRHLQHTCSGTWKHAGAEVVGGCICCDRREAFLEKINSTVESGGVDYIIIESAGVAEPLHVAENFALVQNVVHLDCMVTIVDAVTASLSIDALQVLSRLSDAARKNMFMKKTLARPRKLFQPATQLLVEQVRFANVIFINKCDAVEASVVRDLCSVIGLFNPAAQIHTCTHGKIESSTILYTNMFSMKDAENNELWFSEAHSQNEVFRYFPLQAEAKVSVNRIESKAPVDAQSQNRRRVTSQTTRISGSSYCGKFSWNFEDRWQCFDPTCEEC